MRLFVAVVPPEPIRREVAAWRTDLPGARWVPADRIHLTLRFLGNVAPDRQAALESRLEAVSFRAFHLTLGGVGRFGHPPRVLWVGVDPEAPVRSLANAVSAAVEMEPGSEPPGGPFAPHLTVARLKGVAPHRLRSWMDQAAPRRTEPFVVEAFHLVASRLGPQGPDHSAVRVFEAEASG